MQYFSLLEFTRSITANIRGLDNTPPPDVVHNIQWLCRQFLDPLREAVGCPVIISSGYRCRDLNTAVGGSPTSYHLLGLAADFHPLDPERRDDVIALVREAKVRARSKERLTDYQTGRLADDSLGEGSQAEVLSDSLPVC